MKKLVHIFYSLIFLLSSFLVYLPPVAAAALPPQNWQCMGVTQAGGHSVNLATKEGNFFLPPEDDVWVVECISGASGNACTTGSTAVNAALGLSGFGPEFSVTHNVSQPVKAREDGKLTGESFLWQTDGPDVNHSFFGVQRNPLSSLSADTANLKFSSFYPQNSDTNCVSLRWDPTGIIFDSKTLEPIPGIPVTIYDQNGSKVNLAGVPNPDITRENGQYNFNVEPNKYYSLRVEPSSHTFPSSVFLLPAQNSPDFPYKGIYRGGLFYETPRILRLDIPVDSATPYTRAAKITDWKVFLDKPTNTLKIDGGLTHPFSRVQVGNGGNLLGSTTADQYGAFAVSVHSTVIDNTKPIELTVEKADVFNRVQGISFFDTIIPKIFAQTTKNSVIIHPIFNYLAGYAYNEKGAVVPNATVQIILTVATKPAYQVQADNTGYFRIPSENIPPLPYSLVIQSPLGSSSTLTLTQFALYNRQYSEENQIDYGEYQSDPGNIPQYQPPTGLGQGSGRINPSVTGIPGAGGTTANGTTGRGTKESTGNEGGANPGYSGSPAPNAGASSQAKVARERKNQIALIVLSLLLTGSIGAGVYLYKKRKARELEMQK